MLVQRSCRWLETARTWIAICLSLKPISLVHFSHSVMSNSLRPHGLQHSRLPCPSLSPWVCSNSCPLNWWCHPTTSSSVTSFSFNLSHLFQWVSSSHQVAKVLEFQLQHQSFQSIFRVDFLQEWLVWSPCNPRDSRIFTSTIVRKHQFFSSQVSLQSNFHIHTWLLEKP